MIRPAEAWDFVELTSLFQDFLSLKLTGTNYGMRELHDILLKSMYEQDTFCFVIIDKEDKPSGYLAGYISVDFRGNKSLFVYSAYSRTGLPYSNMEVICKYAESLECKSVTALVDSDNKYVKVMLKKHKFNIDRYLISRKVGG